MDVIIPTTGKRLNQLKECINTLKVQTLEVNIIVVLGTKFSSIKSVIKKICEENNCTLLHEPYKKLSGSHRAVACNYGLKNTSAEFVAFVDDDVSVPPTWAETTIKYFKDQNVAGVTSGCRPYSSPFHLVQTIGSDSHSRHFTETTPVESLPGYNSIYRRKVLELVGGFSEDIGGCEDWELNYRIRKVGWKLCGIPETPVEHRHSYTWRSFVRQMFGYGWSRSRLLRKKHIFTLKHALPTIYFLSLPLFVLNKDLLFTVGVYIAFLSFLTLYVGARSIEGFFKIILTFIVMHISWGLGYLKGLIS